MDENYKRKLSRHYLDRLILKLHQSDKQFQLNPPEEWDSNVLERLQRLLKTREEELALKKIQKEQLLKEMEEEQQSKCVVTTEPELSAPIQPFFQYQNLELINRQASNLSILCTQVESLKKTRANLQTQVEFYQNIKRQLMEESRLKISFIDETQTKSNLKTQLNEIFREMAQLNELAQRHSSRKLNSIKLSMDPIDSVLRSPKQQTRLETWKYVMVIVIVLFLLHQVSQY